MAGDEGVRGVVLEACDEGRLEGREGRDDGQQQQVEQHDDGAQQRAARVVRDGRVGAVGEE